MFGFWIHPFTLPAVLLAVFLLLFNFVLFGFVGHCFNRATQRREAAKAAMIVEYSILLLMTLVESIPLLLMNFSLLHMLLFSIIIPLSLAVVVLLIKLPAARAVSSALIPLCLFFGITCL